MPFFRKKPITIEAHQWFKNGDHPLDGVGMEVPNRDGSVYIRHEGLVVRYYRDPENDGQRTCAQCREILHVHGWIETLEGGHIVCPGDWIITGIKGERYPCKPDIFEKSYDRVEAEL